MEWSNIKERIMRNNAAPVSGYVLAYTRKKVIFRKYDSLEDLDFLFYEDGVSAGTECDKAKREEIMEIHFFDREKEYRVIVSASKRNGILVPGLSAIEHIADFDIQKKDELYKEKILIEPAFRMDGLAEEYITVYNHISYKEENGMAEVDDYRLVMEG